MLGAPQLDAGLQVGSHESGVKGQIPLPRPAGHAARCSPVFGLHLSREHPGLHKETTLVTLLLPKKGCMAYTAPEI